MIIFRNFITEINKNYTTFALNTMDNDQIIKDAIIYIRANRSGIYTLRGFFKNPEKYQILTIEDLYITAKLAYYFQFIDPEYLQQYENVLIQICIYLENKLFLMRGNIDGNTIHIRINENKIKKYKKNVDYFNQIISLTTYKFMIVNIDIAKMDRVNKKNNVLELFEHPVSVAEILNCMNK